MVGWVDARVMTKSFTRGPIYLFDFWSDVSCGRFQPNGGDTYVTAVSTAKAIMS